ncbi:hypothetical protein ACTJJ4_12340 [Microbacterium sp. 22195]|uniref:hypothetical protein n=1 Tax=Microbacterium sp. 22195 TaxID=3453891 RepID=UPI003F835014
MRTVCEQCGKRFRGEGRRTATRVLCDDCYATVMGATAGYLAGGTVADAVSTSGWFRGILGRKRSAP